MKKIQHSLTRLACLAGILISMTTGQAEGRDRWTAKKANAWHAKQPWRVGCNFNPSTAINQLEMWQADSFDTKTIDRELGWAADLGLNSMRVYLHNLLWTQDAKEFLKRVDQFLAIADRHSISSVEQDIGSHQHRIGE